VKDNPISAIFKKSLKIPKGQSEAANRRRIDNTIAKRRRILHRKLKIEQH
jgi:hypothetical protein